MTLGVVGFVVVLLAVRVGVALLWRPSLSPRPVVPTHGAAAFGDPLPEHASARVGAIRWRQAGPAIWAPDGEHLLVGGWDDGIVAMNARTGLVDWTLPGHAGTFTRPLRLRDLDFIVRRGEVPAETDTLRVLTLTPDGKRLVSQGYSIRVWDLATREQEALIPLRGGGAWSAAASPDGKVAAFPWIDSIRIVDLAARSERKPRIALPGNTTKVAWVPPGDRIVAGLDEGRIAIATPHRKSPEIHRVSDSRVTAVLVTNQGRDVRALDTKGVVSIIAFAAPAAPAAPPRRIEPDGSAAAKHAGGRMVASLDGRVVAVSWGGGPIRWLDAATGEPAAGPTAEPGLGSIGWSPEGRLFAAESSQGLRFFGEGAPAPPDAPVWPINAVAWSPDGKSVAVAGGFGVGVRVADAATGRWRWPAVGEGVSSVSWSAGGAFVVASSQSRIVRLDARTGKEPWAHDLPHRKPVRPRLGTGGESALWVDEERDLHLLDLRGTPRLAAPAHLGTKPGGTVPGGIPLPWDPTAAVLVESVPTKVNADGWCTGATRRRLWRAGASEPTAEVDVPGEDVFALSRDGRLAAVGDFTVVVLDLTAPVPREIARFTAKRRERTWGGGYSAAAFSPDASRLALADPFNEIHLHSLPDGRETRTLRGHRAAIVCLALSDDGTRLASRSHDTTALVRDLRD